MNRYKKKVVLKEGASKFILQFERPDRKKPDEKEVSDNNVQIDSASKTILKDILNSSNPIEIEVGFGTGKFLIPYAEKHVNTNILGLEITRKMVDHVANQVMDQKLSNVFIVHCDARFFIKENIPEKSIDRIHVYFPDPWVKKRHIKRRVINQDFLGIAHRILKENGKLNLFTDHKDYFDYFLEQKELFGKFANDVDPGDYTPTSYETKWVRQGRTIYRAILRKN